MKKKMPKEMAVFVGMGISAVVIMILYSLKPFLQTLLLG